jgi:hypothetical protein
MVAGMTWAELRTTDELAAFQSDFQSRGGSVAVVSDPEGRIDATRCASLAYRSGVRRAGSVTVGESVRVANAPGTLFQTATATPEAIRLWTLVPMSDTELSGGVVVGSAAAEELGLRPGMLVAIEGLGVQTVAAVANTDGRNPFVARWVFGVGPPSGFATECWVEFAPATIDVGMQILEAVFASIGPEVEVRRWLELDTFARNPIDELARRPQAVAWLLAGALMAMLMWLSVWTRTSEIGLYRAVGTSTSSIWLMGQLETLYLYAPAASAGFLWSVAAYTAIHGGQLGIDQILIAGRSCGSAFLLSLVLGPLGWLAVGHEQIATQLKDR